MKRERVVREAFRITQLQLPPRPPSDEKNLAKVSWRSGWWGDLLAAGLGALDAGGRRYPQEWMNEEVFFGRIGWPQNITLLFCFVWRIHQRNLHLPKVWPRRRPDSPTENWELLVVFLISFCSPLCKTQKSWEEDRSWLSVEKLWETSLRIGSP